MTLRISNETRNAMIADAKSGMYARQVCEKYSISMNMVYKICRGYFTTKGKREKAAKLDPRKRQISLLKLLGMDYVERRLK